MTGCGRGEHMAIEETDAHDPSAYARLTLYN